MAPNLTCVSAFFLVKNKHGNKYTEWFKNTLAIDCPYVFFTDTATAPLIRQLRGDRPTVLVETTIAEFTVYPLRSHLTTTHPIYCPSVELNLIWNEKPFFVQRAAALNPFKTPWFMWIDAGILPYRNAPPPPRDLQAPFSLPFLSPSVFHYSSSNDYDPRRLSTHYHHISAGNFILHRDAVNDFATEYRDALTRLASAAPARLWTEQVVLTHMFHRRPDRFHKLVPGYGAICLLLFGQSESRAMTRA